MKTNSDPKKKKSPDQNKTKNPEPGKQKPLTVEKQHIVEDPEKGKRERIVSKKTGNSKS